MNRRSAGSIASSWRSQSSIVLDLGPVWDLVVEVEVQPGERLGVAVEEAGRPAADQAVEAGDPLLAVEQELDGARGQGPVAAGPGVLGAGLPDEQAADGVLAVERLHQAADLVAVPDVAALELGQGHAAQVDLVRGSCGSS